MSPHLRQAYWQTGLVWAVVWAWALTLAPPAGGVRADQYQRLLGAMTDHQHRQVLIGTFPQTHLDQPKTHCLLTPPGQLAMMLQRQLTDNLLRTHPRATPIPVALIGDPHQQLATCNQPCLS